MNLKFHPLENQFSIAFLLEWRLTEEWDCGNVWICHIVCHTGILETPPPMVRRSRWSLGGMVKTLEFDEVPLATISYTCF